MSSRSSMKKSGNTVSAEVNRLLTKKDGVSTQDMLALRQKYSDQDLVSQIQQAYTEAHRKITKRARKFVDLLREKYADSNQPFHTLLEKAKKYKKKYGLSDAEFAEFIRIVEQQLVGAKSEEVDLPNTNMMKVLGTISTDLTGFNMKVSDDEYRKLQEIMNLHTSSKPLHSQVLLQSMQYTDCNLEALTGEYNRDMGHMPYQHVHPVVAALFLPKIQTLEHHFLMANIAGIVSARKNKQPLSTRPDFELFYSLVTDPNDVACDSRSPVADLLARANLQNQLWNSVLHLRNGQYYNASFTDFVGAVDVCRLNKYDKPDLIYGQHSGTVLRRLISAFSFRPTIVATSATYKQFSTNPYAQVVRPTVRAVQTINLRLPAVSTDVSGSSSVKLTDALNQQQLFLDGDVVVPRQTSIIYSRGVLMFYVERTATTLRVANTEPFNLNKLPKAAVAGFERVNSRRVNFDRQIKIRDDLYELRSVVINETNINDQKEELVVGSSTLIRCHANIQSTGHRNEACYKYDPVGVSITKYDNTNNQRMANKPIVQIPYGPRVGDENQNFEYLAACRGTIFVYQLVEDNSKGVVMH